MGLIKRAESCYGSRPKLIGPRVSNYPLSYKLSWLPRLLKPSLAGRGSFSASAGGQLLAEKPASVVRLVFLGDISAVANREAPDIDPDLKHVLRSADLVIGNCESPVVHRVRAPLGTRLGVRHAMSPDFLDSVIEACGFESNKLVMSLANNHIFDQGIAGFEETVAHLSQRDIGIAGLVASGPVTRFKVGDVALGLLAFTQWRNAPLADFEGRVMLLKDVARLSGADMDGCDLVCALPHWDWEFRHFSRASTRALARDLAGNGVKLIVGGHAHVVQPVERMGGALVAFGLGDFLGTALPRVPWPLSIGAIFAVDVSTDRATLGSVAAYRVHPFVRTRKGRHERLSLLDMSAASRERKRAEAVFGPL